MEIAICKNEWCKGHFHYDDLVEVSTEQQEAELNNIPIIEKDGKLFIKVNPPRQCNKCISFNNELSSGITWTEKKYDGPRWDDKPQNVTINVRNFYS